MKKAIVLVSFGTTSVDGIKKSINILMSELNEKLGNEYKIFNVFTSDRIRKKLKEGNDIIIHSLDEILSELSLCGYEEVLVKPLHVFDGNEIKNIKEVVESYRKKIKNIELGKSLLGYSGENLINRCSIISKILMRNLNGPLLLIGHGSRTANHDQYDSLIDSLKRTYNGKVFLGTLEGKEPIDEVIEKLKYNNIKYITIIPLLIMPGRHLSKDIISENNSWRSLLNESGITVNYINKSLLEYKEIRNIIYNEIKELHF